MEASCMGINKTVTSKSPDGKWQIHIMYVKISGRFFYLIIFIDEYSRHIVHHSLLTAIDADSVAEPVI